MINFDKLTLSSYSKIEIMQKWYIDNLSIARRNLQKFPILNKIFDDLSGFEKRHHTVRKNVFLDLLFPDRRTGKPIPSIDLLKEIENTLTILDFENMTPRERSDLKMRITSNDEHENLSVFTELLITNRMISRIGQSNIELHPSVKGNNKSDLMINLGLKKVNFEITNLATGKSEIKIQQIFDEICKYLESKFSKNDFGIILYINTFKLKKDEHLRIDVKKSIEFLKKEIDRMNIVDLEGFVGHFSFDNLSYLLKYPNLQKEFLNLSQKELQKSMKQSPLSKWIKKTSSELSCESPITNVSCFPLKTNDCPLAEIHSDDFYPSSASQNENQAFLNHLIRRIKEKVSGGQLHTDTSNVIVVQGYNWTFSHAEITTTDFDPIKDKVDEYFEEAKSEILSGVLYFSTDFDKGIFIPNPHCRDDKKLSSDDWTKLQFRLKPDHDF